MLGAADDQHLLGQYVQPTLHQMPRHRGPLVQTPGVGLIAQQGFEITGQRQLAQGIAQQVRLARQ
ncbi:hypothetical protein D3C71_1800890 [compost metagenome]